MSAETMKIPEPIIEPATTIVESNKPKPRTKPSSFLSSAAIAHLEKFLRFGEIIVSDITILFRQLSSQDKPLFKLF
jgi:hypothetical protein